MTMFKSPKGEIPEIDVTKLDLIISLLSTFESNDLHTRNAVNFRYDKKRDYVFLDIMSIHNGEKVADCVLGFDKEKVCNVCQSVLDYFETKNENGK
ncbi:MAG: hypothetical protein PHF86_02845 [Candidatus Nanoarchaeia archaeon]|nr:hypothetical protein [Candidatus Nanoarchaeia archaeon]